MFRILLILAALCASLPAYAQVNGIGNNASENHRPRQTEDYPSHIAQPNYLAAIDWRLRQIGRLLDAQIADEQSAKSDDRAERNVKAQERVADYAPWMLALGVIEIAITFVGVVLVRRTILESRAATEDDIRPYVQMSRCAFERPSSGKSRFVVKIQNSGQTPATFFEVCFSIKAFTMTEEGVDWTMPTSLERSQMWNALGGNDTVTLGLYDPNLIITANDVNIENKVLYLLGKVRYGDIWGNEYETQFAYWTRDATQTMVGNSVIGVSVKARKMTRATGSLQTFVLTKRA